MSATETLVAPPAIELAERKSPAAQEEAITLSDEPPADAAPEVERWNHPRSNIIKLVFAFISFMVVGMNDAAIGVR